MKRWGMIILLSAILGASAAFAQPKLKVVPGLNIDFGKIEQGKVATKHLMLKNTGNQSLTLGKIDVSCGCTGTVLSKKDLKPGDTTSLRITFNSTGFLGPVHKSLTINSNSAGTPQTVVDLLATVVVDLSFSPAWFYFKDAEAGRTSTAVVTLKNESQRAIKVTGFRTQLPSFTLKYSDKPFPPGATMDLTAEFTPQDNTPVMNDSVFVKTSSRMQPELCIRVYRTVKKLK